MNMSHKWTFSIFSVLLIAAFVFVATPVMAQTTVTAWQQGTAATATAGEKIVITLTYSDNPDPRPTIGDFTAADNAISNPDDDDTDRDVLTASYNDGTNAITAAVGGSGKTVTLTFIGPAGDGTTVGADIALPTTLQLKGYLTDLNTATEGTAATVADGSVVPVGLAVETNYIRGKSYVVYVRGTTATQAGTPIPVLPSSLVGTGTGQISDTGTTAADSQLVRTIDPTATTGNSNMAMPDLEEFFNVGGGTIDLVVTGVGDREVVINEINWGVDNSRLGQTGETSQQWIEVHNRKTTPAAAPTFIFTNGDGTSYAPAKANNVVDRITNIAGVQNVWDNPRIKGSSGSATRLPGSTPGTEGNINGANPAFTSIYRSNYGAGDNANHWTASTRAFFPGFLGTPGAANLRGGFPSTRPNPPAYTPPANQLVINEVFNHKTKDFDWIELRAVSGAVNLKNWVLNYTDGSATTEHRIINFPERTVGAGEVLLIVNKEPSETDLAAGIDITISSAENQQRGAGPHKYLNVKGALDIKDEAIDGYLILRNSTDAKFNGGRGHLHDVAGVSRKGHNTIATDGKEPQTGHYWKTDVWPLNGHSTNKPNDLYLQTDRNFANGKVWKRDGGQGWRRDGGSHATYVGGIGYDRGIKGAGTPGYHNNVVKNTQTEISGKLVISEMMLATDNGRYPQWIELYNTSKTHGIDTADTDGGGPKKDWKIRIENHNSGKWKSATSDKTVVEFNLKDLFRYIPPNQTVLIVSDKTSHSATDAKKVFPEHRVESIWVKKRDDFLMGNRRDIFLNAEGGFYIKITDGAGATSDEIGNLDGASANIRSGVGYDDPFGWHWFGAEDATEEDALMGNRRTSIIRLKNDDGTFRAGTPVRAVVVEDDPETADVDESMNSVAANESRGAVLPMGTRWRGAGKTGETGAAMKHFAKYEDYAWVHAVDTKMARSQSTWYGSSNDYGTPGHTTSTPLPVSLSFFRPTLEDGKVTIQWTTESELENAGFNILRSDTRDGEFRQVNEQMIQGKGTTAERSTYKWVDTTAKLGAVYYYQIEDVSFAGEHNTLATTKLKGLISAKGKLTTQWGELKNLR